MLVVSGAAQSSVWKVSRGASVVYLGGTCHLLRASDFPLPAEFDAAFRLSRELYFETDIARMQSPEMQQVVLVKGLFTDGRSLESTLPPDAWRAVRAYCETAGMPIAQASRMKPWLFAVSVALLEFQKIGISAEGVDLHYHKLATREGKKIGHLETFEHHLDLITGLGAGRESEMVSKSLEDVAELPTVIEALLKAWKAGDLAKLDQLMVREMREKYPTIYKALLADRNRAWLPRIEQMFQTPETEFVLVGVGHMAGSEGIITELRARGYQIEQVKRNRP
jgi:uncharacterized protein